MSRPDVSPHGLARAALEREHARVQEMPRPAKGVAIGTFELPDGRVRLVDLQTRETLGTAVNAAQAKRTRDFFR